MLKGVLVGQPSRDRRQHDQIDELGIELRSSRFGDHTQCGRRAAATMIPPRVRYGIESIGDGDDARFDRYALATQAARIAGAVPPFVMRGDANGQVGIEGLEWPQDLGAADRMATHRGAFRSTQSVCFVDDIEKRPVDLSDVVK